MANFNYAARDYDTIKSDLLARASQVFPEWTDRDPSDFGMMFVDLVSYVGDVLHYYIDRAASEAFLPTATQRESVLAFANLLDYTPQGRTSATGTVTVVTTDSTAFPAYTEFVARYNDTTYDLYVNSAFSESTPGTYVLDARQGTPIVEEELTNSSNGQPGQRYPLQHRGVVSSAIRVFVYENGIDPVEYQYTGRLTGAATGERVFTYGISSDGDFVIQFGTQITGFVPPNGARVTATYATSDGADGNLPALTAPAVNFKTGTPPSVTVTSSSAFTGGVNEESIASLKRTIPSAFSNQNRAVTRADFVAMALQVPGVAKASLSFVPSSPSANASVTIYPQPQRSDYLTTTDVDQAVSTDMQEEVVRLIQPRALLGVDVLCAPLVEWEPIDVSVTVHINERAVQNWVSRDVLSALNGLFAFDNVHFGQRITLGQIYRIVMNVIGVDYCVVDLFDETGSSAIQDNILVDALKLPKNGTISVTPVGGITTSG